jgi:citronellol/citronellal dehydrogenase
VVLVGRRPEPLERVAAELVAAGGRAHPFPADVRDWDRLGELHDELADRWGRVDAVVNAAGGQFASRAEDISPNGWRAVVETNLTGTFLVCRRLFPLLCRHGGAVVNVVANIWQGAAPGMAHSGAARAGVVSLTRTLAVEWAEQGVRVNALSPGITDTEALRRATGDLSVVAGRVPLGRPATVEEVADAALFLIGSAYTTGAVLTIDGGLHLA